MAARRLLLLQLMRELVRIAVAEADAQGARALLTAEWLHAVYGIIADVTLGADGVPHVAPVASARKDGFRS